MKFLKLVIPFFLVFFLFSCDDAEINVPDAPIVIIEEPTNIDISDNFGLEITRGFIGRIIDIDENPIENVTMKIGSSTAITDENGVFIINNASVFERFAYVTASKEGYIHGSRALIPTNGINNITIMLLDDTVVGSTESGSVTTISLANGASVLLNGEYIDENGATYTGTVDVILHHLDSADDNMFNQMPGMLYAANSNNEEQVLQSYGMLAVELRGSNGEDLNIADGSTAEITIPMNTDLSGIAPGTIPLWYFDEVKGYWIEDGQASLQDNNYVGTVTHFSFWNTDANFPTVSLCINVTDADGNPVANQRITLFNPDLIYPTTSGYTNDNGEVCGLIPSNLTLELNALYFDFCETTPIFTTNIGPFAEDTIINITIPTDTEPNAISETITGVFNTCNGDVVTNGYVILTYGNQTFINPVDNGTFEINLIRCTDENAFSIIGNDYDNTQTTGEINYTFTTPLTNLGTISSCNDVTEFIQYTIDGDNTTEVIIAFNINASFTENDPNINNQPTINISGNSNGNCFYMSSVLNASPYIGAYNYQTDTNGDGITYDEIGFNIIECIDMTETNNNVIFNLTSLGAVDEYIDINFAGDYEGFNGNPHTITGTIHVIRDN